MVDFPSGVPNNSPTFLVGGDANTQEPAKTAIGPAGQAAVAANTPDQVLAATGAGTPSIENASRALTALDNGKSLICSSVPTFTVPAGMVLGYGMVARNSCLFVGGPGVTVTDDREAGATVPWCALLQTAIDGSAYSMAGTKI
ncbi:MAG: hypothetical protein WC869_00755 [Phycisphaerae bacterium]|jgi:hypothetical protein